jgi:hypothetical protein
MARRHTFIDVDENRLELWLKQDRVQLVVIDSRPELEAAELRRFASVMFAEYVGHDLAARLAVARARLCEARDRAADRALGDELTATLDGALRAIEDVVAAVAVPAALPEPELVPQDEDEDDADAERADAAAAGARAGAGAVPPAVAAAPRVLTGRQPYPLLGRRKATRGTPAREPGAPGWRPAA